MSEQLANAMIQADSVSSNERFSAEWWLELAEAAINYYGAVETRGIALSHALHFAASSDKDTSAVVNDAKEFEKFLLGE